MVRKEEFTHLNLDFFFKNRARKNDCLALKGVLEGRLPEKCSRFRVRCRAGNPK
jgi:hypothetical protein